MTTAELEPFRDLSQLDRQLQTACLKLHRAYRNEIAIRQDPITSFHGLGRDRRMLQEIRQYRFLHHLSPLRPGPLEGSLHEILARRAMAHRLGAKNGDHQIALEMACDISAIARGTPNITFQFKGNMWVFTQRYPENFPGGPALPPIRSGIL